MVIPMFHLPPQATKGMSTVADLVNAESRSYDMLT